MKSFAIGLIALVAVLSGGIMVGKRPLSAGGVDDGPPLTGEPRNAGQPARAAVWLPTPIALETSAESVRPDARGGPSAPRCAERPRCAEPPPPVWPAEKVKPEPVSAAAPTCAAVPVKSAGCLPAPRIPDLPEEPTAPKSSTVAAHSARSATAAPKGEIKSVSGVLGDMLPLPAGPIESADASPPAAPVRMVNDKRFSINYEVKDVGPTGVSQIDLWYTSDGRDWHKAGTIHEANSPYTANVDRDGLYGLTMVARSGVGLGKRPPRPGDAPQVWIEVDTTKPEVKLTGLRANLGPDSNHLVIGWTATDKNLGPKPITLSYAEQADGPWKPIVANLENTGRYVWQVPKTASPRLMLRVEATDLVGNIGEAQTPEPVTLDLAQPVVSILGVEPASK
jgi:hypothetical protein